MENQQIFYGLEIRTSSNEILNALLIRKLTTKLIPISVGQFLILSIMMPTVWIIQPGVLCNGINCYHLRLKRSVIKRR